MFFSVSLTVPADPAFESLLIAFIDDGTARASLTERRCAAIRTAGINAFRILVNPGMNEQREPLHLHLTEGADAVLLRFTQRGLPIDAQYAARDERWNQILQSADRAAWRWHGRTGTELALRFVHGNSSQGTHSVPPAHEEPVQAAPEQEYQVRRFVPADARGVARCFYATYGYGYDVPAVYEPRRLTKMNENEEYISFVALDRNGEVVAHYALHREPGAAIAEGCGAVVDPRHRGRHLLERLRARAESHARDIGLAAYYTEPVTDHAITQRESEKFGAHITAISLGYSPRTMLAKHMEGLTATSQRQSLTLYVKPLRPLERRRIFAPARHREMLARIYAQLGIPVDMHDGDAAPGEGTLQTMIEKASQVATIRFDSVGTQTPGIARQAVSDLRQIGGLGTVYAMLPLADPGTPRLGEALEREGFFFSGLAPLMHARGDALRLQLLLDPVDSRQLTIASEFGRELLAYIDSTR
jgi:hypothetical protein